MQLLIDTSNTQLSVRNQCFFISNENTSRQISPKRISSIAITSNCNINSSAIKLAAIHQVPVLFFDNIGELQAKTWSPYFVNLADLRKKQLQFSQNQVSSVWIIDRLSFKIREQMFNLKQLSEYAKSVKQNNADSIVKMGALLNKLDYFKSLNIEEKRQEIMGLEGSLSRIYFNAVNLSMPELFRFAKRSRRPALDHFNAALNYLYGMTYTIVEHGLFAKGLDPSNGILHVDVHNRPTLTYDLIEPIRPITDRLLFELITSEQLTSSSFVAKDNGFWVGKEGKKILITSFNDYMKRRIKSNGQVKTIRDHIYWESSNLTAIINSFEI